MSILPVLDLDRVPTNEHLFGFTIQFSLPRLSLRNLSISIKNGSRNFVVAIPQLSSDEMREPILCPKEHCCSFECTSKPFPNDLQGDFHDVDCPNYGGRCPNHCHWIHVYLLSCERIIRLRDKLPCHYDNEVGLGLDQKSHLSIFVHRESCLLYRRKATGP